MYLQDFVGPLTMFEAMLNRGVHIKMEDAEVLAFLASRRRTATCVTSVCTGSLILGPGRSTATRRRRTGAPVTR